MSQSRAEKAGDIGRLLAHVKKPSRYVGHEFNAATKNWGKATLRVGLVFPDLYEIGMSHHGLHVLYSVINSRDDLLADRVYAPDRDLEELLRSRGENLFGLESRKPLAEFDMIGITLPYELCYTNILTVLDLGGIPLRAAARDEFHPIVIGGGSGSFNPEPVVDFFDAILLGDGEEAVLEIADVLINAKQKKWRREEILAGLTEIPGLYVPRFFEPLYDADGKLQEVKSLKKGYEKVQRRILPDLETSHVSEKPLVPLVRIVHDRLGVEVARGCTRGCRFCQAGIIYRPVRERSANRVVELAEKGMAAGGFDELALLSLSTGDYSCLSPALQRLMDRFVREYISVSMPSMRVGTLTPEIMAQIKRVRKTGFTLAPEAGSDRLRQVINKGITEEDLLETCREAHELGWKLLKFYFMFGLPTETIDDVKAIAELVKKAHLAAGKKLRINVSVATFVPKPHTPFQWEKQLSIEESFARIDLLKKSLPRGNYKLKWHDPRQSFLEGVMSRGDRKLAGLIEDVWQRGARLDAWTEEFDLDMWMESSATYGLDLEQYLHKRHVSEVLPWSHLDTGVDPEFLKAELARSLTGEYTPDCRVHGCQKCGSCDFEEIMPVVMCRKKKTAEADIAEGSGDVPASLPVHAAGVAAETGVKKVVHHWYRLHYSKQGDIRFLSHLEVIQAFFQSFRRAGVKMHFSQGFNPVPKAAFSPALPVGTESLDEHLDIDLVEEIRDENRFVQDMNRNLPDGIMILSLEEVPVKAKDSAAKIRVHYKVNLARRITPEDRGKIRRFIDSDTVFISKIRKGKQRRLNIRKQVESIKEAGEESMELEQVIDEGKAASKPAEIIQAILGLSREESCNLSILKTRVKAL